LPLIHLLEDFRFKGIYATLQMCLLYGPRDSDTTSSISKQNATA